jgi:UDP-N-acetyl-D-glucosamine/UDP-N-acetyl-D-galactosamine dehydrogenase
LALRALNFDVVVVGLGYVGLPLAVALSKQFATAGFDINRQRIDELNAGYDRTNEIDSHKLRSANLKVTADPEQCPISDFYIVTVPTPVDDHKRPDLSILEAATVTVAAMVRRASRAGRIPIIVFESTVYPGVTEEICAPIIEREAGLVCGSDFFVGYSPERINPGDREHTIDKITKVVAGQTSEVLEKIAQLYDRITTGGVFRAASIRAAEAAKVIENAQRDINIAFMNEITQIFQKCDLSIWDVLDAAKTKWNFLPFSPGLVGGHCIGVDPYYLAHRAEQMGFDPKVILAGRGVNDSMASWVAGQLHDVCGHPGRALVLGLTFKEDVPDLRNSKVADLVAGLVSRGHEVVVHDPLADPGEALHEYSLVLDPEALDHQYDLVVLAVSHSEYLDMGPEQLRKRLNATGILADLRGVLNGRADWTL